MSCPVMTRSGAPDSRRGHWTVDGDRWYGRGTAGQQGAAQCQHRGAGPGCWPRAAGLGCNVKWLFETGEETGSPGLRAVCEVERTALAADVFIASDGAAPGRCATDAVPGLPGRIQLRPDRLLARRRPPLRATGEGSSPIRERSSPMRRIARRCARVKSCAAGATGRRFRRPFGERVAFHRAGRTCRAAGTTGNWASGLTTRGACLRVGTASKCFAFKTGNPEHPVNHSTRRRRISASVPSVGCEPPGSSLRCARISTAKRLRAGRGNSGELGNVHATRLDPEHPWVRGAWPPRSPDHRRAARHTPNLGGSLPNDWLRAVVWPAHRSGMPHSYPALFAHAPNEHTGTVAREGLAMMTGLFWTSGATPPASGRTICAASNKTGHYAVVVRLGQWRKAWRTTPRAACRTIALGVTAHRARRRLLKRCWSRPAPLPAGGSVERSTTARDFDALEKSLPAFAAIVVAALRHERGTRVH